MINNMKEELSIKERRLHFKNYYVKNKEKILLQQKKYRSNPKVKKKLNKREKIKWFAVCERQRFLINNPIELEKIRIRIMNDLIN